REGDLTPGGAIIAGSDVEIINGDSLQNIGTIKADQNLTVNTGSITNQFGRITGGEVNLTADDTLANISGLISGDNVTITAGSILNQTATQTDTYKKETSPSQSHLPSRFGLTSSKQEPSG
ncbi:filamentous hemagglutinin family outer membrane protein, partial [Acetonema longum]